MVRRVHAVRGSGLGGRLSAGMGGGDGGGGGGGDGRRVGGGPVLALVAVPGCAELGLPDGAVGAPGGPAVTGTAPAATVPAASVARARAELAGLTVADPREGGYQRTRDFGPAWSVDVDRNGCGTRDDILRRDLEKVQLRGRCTVIAGVLADPYTGRSVTFTKS